MILYTTLLALILAVAGSYLLAICHRREPRTHPARKWLLRSVAFGLWYLSLQATKFAIATDQQALFTWLGTISLAAIFTVFVIPSLGRNRNKR